MNKTEIVKLVNNYEKGTYNPFKYEVEHEHIDEENEDEMEI